jgi:hypothetical protein
MPRQRRADSRRHATLPQSDIQRENRQFETHRSRKRSPNLCPADRVVAGLCALLIRPSRLIRSAIVLRPSTLLRLHQALQKRKYRLLFSPNAERAELAENSQGFFSAVPARSAVN